MLKKQISNFIFVGVINTLFGYTVYAILISVGFSYVISALFATIIGMLFNFKTIGRYVFGVASYGLMNRFFAVYLIVLLVNISIIKIIKMYDYNDYVAGLAAVVPCATISFIFNKFFVFKA